MHVVWCIHSAQCLNAGIDAWRMRQVILIHKSGSRSVLLRISSFYVARWTGHAFILIIQYVLLRGATMAFRMHAWKKDSWNSAQSPSDHVKHTPTISSAWSHSFFVIHADSTSTFEHVQNRWGVYLFRTAKTWTYRLIFNRIKRKSILGWDLGMISSPSQHRFIASIHNGFECANHIG